MIRIWDRQSGLSLLDTPPEALHRNGSMMSEQSDEQELRMELARLRQEHRDLDTAVAALAATQTADALQLQRLKKKKLLLKERIVSLEDQLFPDIIA